MQEATRKLDVTRILLSAALAPAAHWRRILWFAIPLILIEFAVLLLTQYAGSTPVQSLLGVIVLGIASLLAWLLLAVACHRILILGEESMAGSGLVWWTSRETRFFGWSVGIGLLAACVLLPFFALLQVTASSDPAILRLTSYIMALPAFYLIMRLSLVLPATAVDSRPDLRWAWGTSRGNGIRLMLVIGLLPLLLQIFVASMPEIQSLVYEGALAVVGIYVAVVEIAALSMSFRELVPRHSLPTGQVRTAA